MRYRVVQKGVNKWRAQKKVLGVFISSGPTFSTEQSAQMYINNNWVAR